MFNDYPGYQKVALAAQAPILEERGVEVFRMPTALFSNTLNYGDVARLDTTEYMKEALAAWGRLGFTFDAIATGFATGAEQIRVILQYCKEQRRNGVALFCDPIMADHGKLYGSITADHVEYMKELISLADYATPNYTEACFLTGWPWEERVSLSRAKELLDVLRDLGVKSPVITSVPLEEGDAVVGYDGTSGQYFEEYFQPIPIPCYGTGDCFLAYLMERVLAGAGLQQAVRSAMDSVEAMLR